MARPRVAERHRHGRQVRGGCREPIGQSGDANLTVDSIVGDGHVEAVRLSDGTQVAADLVLIGLGVVPVTDWLEGSGLHIDDGVVCDATCAVGGHQCCGRR
jgi:NAD(P)H-nitrite reductase large subunit